MVVRATALSESASVSVFSRMKVMQERTRETDKDTTLPRTKTTRYITAHILYVGLGVRDDARTHTQQCMRAPECARELMRKRIPHSLHRLQAHRPGSHMGKVLMAAFLKVSIRLAHHLLTVLAART